MLLNRVTLRESSSSTTGHKNLLSLSGFVRFEAHMTIQYIYDPPQIKIKMKISISTWKKDNN